ncbi:hypothetical protein B0J11DRAFT_281797 [Dendryphion nanum]|uniref:Uncharacterized protein n=1 Tax=Dendryphion nanum TaxID=256645 RepID=A0A9P9DVR8_9PLEO|nr:hypothetical protein B0J11DRAFT_281797 [Dendryphion nanum]
MVTIIASERFEYGRNWFRNPKESCCVITLVPIITVNVHGTPHGPLARQNQQYQQHPTWHRSCILALMRREPFSPNKCSVSSSHNILSTKTTKPNLNPSPFPQTPPNPNHLYIGTKMKLTIVSLIAASSTLILAAPISSSFSSPSLLSHSPHSHRHAHIHLHKHRVYNIRIAANQPHKCHEPENVVQETVTGKPEVVTENKKQESWRSEF